MHPRRRPVFLALSLSSLTSAVLLMGACADVSDADAALDGIEGVAVVVEMDGDALAPGIFQGTAAEARERSRGTFRFAADAEGVIPVPMRATWIADAGEGGAPVQGVAVVAHGDDGTVRPGIFRGPMALAEVIATAWAEARDRDTDAAAALEMPEEVARVLAFEPGTPVRVRVGG